MMMKRAVALTNMAKFPINPIALVYNGDQWSKWGGGGSGGLNPPNVQRRTLAFMLFRETLQKILDRKTPPNVLPYFAHWW